MLSLDESRKTKDLKKLNDKFGKLKSLKVLVTVAKVIFSALSLSFPILLLAHSWQEAHSRSLSDHTQPHSIHCSADSCGELLIDMLWTQYMDCTAVNILSQTAGNWPNFGHFDIDTARLINVVHFRYVCVCESHIYSNHHFHSLSLTRSLTYSFTHSLAHSLTHSLTYSLAHSLTHSLAHSLAHSLTHILTHLHTHSLAHSPTHSHTHSPTRTLTLTHPLTHSLTCTLTHPFTHSLAHSPTHSHTHSPTRTLTLTHPLTHSLTHSLTCTNDCLKMYS